MSQPHARAATLDDLYLGCAAQFVLMYLFLISSSLMGYVAFMGVVNSLLLMN